jgi:hypothetical protein
METKICRTCSIEKPINEFCVARKNNDGYNHFCKSCQRDKDKLYRKNNIEKNSKRLKEYNLKPEIKLQRSKYAKEFRLNNLATMRTKALEKQKINRKDSMYKFKESIRNRIRNSIKHIGSNKNSKTSIILGCTFEEFRNYIESKFESWMTWGNRGLYNGTEGFGWDLDHIIPTASAMTEDDVIKLNHYSNFQPLCSHINRNIKKDNLI